MRCGVLGPLEVREDGGALLVVPGAKERRLLGLLVAAHPAAVTVDRLMDQLWDGSPPPTARKSLHAHVVRLRTALEPDRAPRSPGRYVIRREDGYVLSLGSHEIDAGELTELAVQGRALLSSGDEAAARSTLQRALDLWRGEPYADWPDAEFTALERRRLERIRADATIALLECELALGRHREVVPQLEHMVLEEPLHEELWSMLAVALYRSGRQGDALATIRRARDVLVEEIGVSPGPLLRSTEQDVLAQSTTLDAPDRPGNGTVPDTDDVRAGGCPYKGLATYEPEDAALFRGRGALVNRLVAKLVDNPMIVISGSSGAGKSSLARAGLLPALAAGAIPGAERWRQLVVTSGPRAVDALAGVTEVDDTQPPVLLVCDQLEEQWFRDTDPRERDAFLDSVRGLLAEGRVARCLLVIRADHLGKLFEHRAMTDATTGLLELVPPLSEPELREVVEAPAEALGLGVEPELVDTVVRDVLGRVGGLPLLSMAMVGTWVRRRDRTLTLAGYLESGGVTGAVARTAEEAIRAFDAASVESARRVLVRLADHDEHGGFSRRRVPLAELGLDGPDGEARRAIVDALVAHRLLTMDTETLEVAHEALLTAWPRLADWLADDAVGRRVRRHLAPAAREWESHQRPQDELYRGGRLQASMEWAAMPEADATPLEREFLVAGAALAESEVSAAHARADAEAAGRARVRRLAMGLSAALVLALLAIVVAVGYQQTAADRAIAARTAQTVAEANRLAALSRTARSLDLTLLLAAQAMRTARTPGTEEGLFDAMLSHRRATGVFAMDDQVDQVAISPNGRSLFAVHGTGEPTLVSWSLGSSERPRVIDDSWPWGLAPSPRGNVVAAADWSVEADDVEVALTSRAGTRVATMTGTEALGGWPLDLLFTRHGRLLEVVEAQAGPRSEWEAHVAELDVRGGRHGRLRRIMGSGSPAINVAAKFARDGSGVLAFTEDFERAAYLDLRTGGRTTLAVERRNATPNDFLLIPGGVLQTWTDGTMTRYDAQGRPAQLLGAHADTVNDALVLPDGRTGVTVGDGGVVLLWNIAPRSGEWTRREELVGHSGDVRQAEVSKDGATLYTASQDGRLIRWDVSGSGGFGSPYGRIGERWISNRLEVLDPGRVVVMPTRSVSTPHRGSAATTNVAAVFMDPRTGAVLDRVHVGTTHSEAIFGSAVAVSPDRNLVAVTHAWGTAVLDAGTHEVVAHVRLPASEPQAEGEASEIVSSVSWTPDGSHLVLGTAGEEGDRHERLVLVDSQTWRPSGRALVPAQAQVLQWSPDRTQLAVGSETTRSVTFLDGDLREERTAEIGDHPFDIDYSPDGSMLAAGGADGEVTVLDTQSGRQVQPPAKVFSGFVTDVEWLPDGKRVVAAGQDDSAALYDVEADIVRAGVMPASDTLVEGYAYLLPDPRDEVVVMEGEQPGRRYPLDPQLWLALACEVVGRDLTQSEWDRYVPGEPYRPTCSDLGAD